MRVLKMYCDRCGKEFEKWDHKYEEKIGVAELTHDAGDADHPYLDTQKDLCKSCYTELENWWSASRTAESRDNMPSDMTKEEAIYILQNRRDIVLHMDDIDTAINMGIKALELIKYIEQRYEEECDERRKQYSDGWYHSLSMCDGASYALGQVLDKWKGSNEEQQSVDDAMDAYTLDHDNYDIDCCQ